ncbi:MAG: NAD(P)H-dependent oxidoreductase [Candidatus Sumerlaeaceae bacterium]|nr:NAD(P)H-dependent oxidoreductase [Candidatus Sumerlaeaceae bacterium]
MSNILIVYAHEEPRSFNGALKDTAVQVLSQAGHAVTVSDLYTMNFNPTGGSHDFTQRAYPDFFKYGKEQMAASERGTFVEEVAAEQRKLFACDLLIFQFPLWWFGLPAILKGWVDRVFAAGLTYGNGRFYSNGLLRGRRALACLTTGGPESMYSRNGINGDMEQILFPINHGIFYFVGFEVLRPFVAYAVSHMTPEQRAACLAQYAERLRHWQTEPTIPYRPLEDYDEHYILKTGLPAEP